MFGRIKATQIYPKSIQKALPFCDLVSDSISLEGMLQKHGLGSLNGPRRNLAATRLQRRRPWRSTVAKLKIGRGVLLRRARGVQRWCRIFETASHSPKIGERRWRVGFSHPEKQRRRSSSHSGVAIGELAAGMAEARGSNEVGLLLTNQRGRERG